MTIDREIIKIFTKQNAKNKTTYNFVPVSLEYIIGGAKFASPKFLWRGYLVLLNKCRTIQIKPARTAIPDVTPSSVGRSDVMMSMSKNKMVFRSN